MGLFSGKDTQPVKELYIRRGNSAATECVIIIGEELSMGERDLSGYRPGKGAAFVPIRRKDPYSGGIGLTYIHAVPNIRLDSGKYRRDYDVHEFVKAYCRDIVKWDGEADRGMVRSREAFIAKGDPGKVAEELYRRIETEVHGGVPSGSILAKKVLHALFVPGKKKSHGRRKVLMM